jgi:predicted RNA-binding protein with PUA-like domain/energy-coupling factor transporter ATP-binding protein EcfA2
MPDHGAIWLLQIERDSDLYAYLEDLRQGHAEAFAEYTVDRYFRQMQAGDQLLFWASGMGLIGLGKLLSDAYLDQDSETWQIGFQIEGLLPEPLSRKQLKSQPVWQAEPFIKRPQGHVFKVSFAAWQALETLLPPLILPTLPSEQKKFAKLAQKIRQSGLLISQAMLMRYHLALSSSSLVILNGPSGVGKSWLAQSYAQLSGAEYCLLAVSPHWSQPEDWLGYFNPLEKGYFDSEASLFLKRAAHEWSLARREGRRPQAYHLILDEMNLARVEHYFAPLLSGLEIQRRQGMAHLSLGSPEPLLLTPNLRVIGTINLDESTHLLADKIYDRAQVLFLQASLDDLNSLLEGQPYQSLLVEIFRLFEPLIPISLRSCKDICTYIQTAQTLDITWQNALDQQLLQKIFARLRSAEPEAIGLLKAVEALLPAQDFPLAQKQIQHLKAQWLKQGFVFGS